jgi:hypothetical protein
MAERYRWSNTGAELIRTQARDGAMLRGLDEPRPPRREHVHVYLHAAKVADQAAPAGGVPVRTPRPAPKHYAPPRATASRRRR